VIRIHRDSNPPAIDAFTKQTVKLPGGKKITRAQNELARAIAFFTDPANFKNDTKLSKQTFTFRVYKDPGVVKALEAVFGSKCAYCESRFAHVTPKEVEHFRPKSEIENRDSPPLLPGYFWLACEWTNLLVSCPDCNRARKHEVPGQTKKVRLGKQTQFPLRDEIGRVRSHTGNVATEEPLRLLLDPTIDYPEVHLTFDDEGLVHPRINDTGLPSEMGKVSIDVYALQRKALVEERLRVINDVVFQFGLLRDLVVELANFIETGQPENLVEAKREQVRKLKAHLVRCTASDAPYLAMVRDYVRRTKADGKFDDLIKAGIDPENLLAS
jgi:uncharacterized protein (TIGR02646 family)